MVLAKVFFSYKHSYFFAPLFSILTHYNAIVNMFPKITFRLNTAILQMHLCDNSSHLSPQVRVILISPALLFGDQSYYFQAVPVLVLLN